MRVFTGYIKAHDGQRIQFDFGVPAGTTDREIDSAAIGALRGVVELDYLEIGTTNDGACAAPLERSSRTLAQLGLRFTLGNGDLWLCHTQDGMGFDLRPVCGGEAWDWSASLKWWHGCGTGQAETREAAVDAALEALARAGADLAALPGA